MMIILFSLIMVFLIITFLIGNYFFNIVFNPKVSKKYILRSITEEDKKNERIDKIKGEEWLKQFGTEIKIISTDNKVLNGYKVSNPIKKSNIWVIIVHGYMGCAKEMVKYAKKFIYIGYNVLLVDLRAHGKSEGKYIGMGWKDKDDLLCWINKICKENKNSKIILYGISMGASTVMMTIGEKLPYNVKLAIEDCGYSSVFKEFKSMLKTVNPIISKYVIFSTNIVTKLKIGFYFNEASCINQIINSKIPILFIHGDKDTFVPFEMLEEVYQACNSKKEKIVIKNAGHTKSSKLNPDVYWKKIENFTKKYL